MLTWPPDGSGWEIVFLGGLFTPEELPHVSSYRLWLQFALPPRCKDRQNDSSSSSSFSNQRPSLHPGKAKWWWRVESSHPILLSLPNFMPITLAGMMSRLSGGITVTRITSLLAIFSTARVGTRACSSLCPNRWTPFQRIYYLIWWVCFQCFKTTNWDQNNIKMECG